MIWISASMTKSGSGCICHSNEFTWLSNWSCRKGQSHRTYTWSLSNLFESIMPIASWINSFSAVATSNSINQSDECKKISFFTRVYKVISRLKRNSVQSFVHASIDPTKEFSGIQDIQVTWFLVIIQCFFQVLLQATSVKICKSQFIHCLCMSCICLTLVELSCLLWIFVWHPMSQFYNNFRDLHCLCICPASAALLFLQIKRTLIENVMTILAPRACLDSRWESSPQIHHCRPSTVNGK